MTALNFNMDHGVARHRALFIGAWTGALPSVRRQRCATLFAATQMLPRSHGMSTLLGLMDFYQGLRAPPLATDAWLRATRQ